MPKIWGSFGFIGGALLASGGLAAVAVTKASLNKAALGTDVVRWLQDLVCALAGRGGGGSRTRSGVRRQDLVTSSYTVAHASGVRWSSTGLSHDAPLVGASVERCSSDGSSITLGFFFGGSSMWSSLPCSWPAVAARKCRSEDSYLLLLRKMVAVWLIQAACLLPNRGASCSVAMFATGILGQEGPGARQESVSSTSKMEASVEHGVGIPHLHPAKWFVPGRLEMAGDLGSVAVEGAKDWIAFPVKILGSSLHICRSYLLFSFVKGLLVKCSHRVE